MKTQDDHSNGQQLQRLLQTTEQMLDHAQRMEWEQLEQLQEQRNCDLREGLGEQVDSPDVESVRDTLATLLSLNDRLVKQVAEARGEVMANSRKLQQSRSGASSYQKLQMTT